MKTYFSITEINNKLQGVSATVGNFDGCHLGHRAIIEQVVATARQKKLESLVITFDPHPVKVLFPQILLKNIFDVEDKIRQLSHLGVNHMLMEPFSRELSQLTPEHFFQHFILNLNVKNLFVGHDFSFAKDRSGTLEVLDALCTKNNVELAIVPAVKVNGETVSSSRIRKAIIEGDVAHVSRMLKRPYYMSGVVEKGAGRGRKLGFPTANLFTSGEIFPKNGVYQTWTVLKGQTYKSLTNVGVNPTFTEKNRRPIQVETFILDFDQDIYGETLQVHFLDYLRAEMKFKSVDELISQMHDDVRSARHRQWQPLS